MTREYLSFDGVYHGRCERKTVAFTAVVPAVGVVGALTLFTVTGAVVVRLSCVCTESLVCVAGGTIEVGIAGTTTTFIAQAVSLDIDVGDIWHDATPDSANELWSVTAVTAERILGNGQDIIATIGAQDLTDGTLVFNAYWTPLTADGLVVAA